MKQGTLVTKVVIGLFLTVLVLYLALSGMKTLTNPYKIVRVHGDSVEESLALNSWVFRREMRLSAAQGLISYHVDDGEKTAAGQPVASAYDNQEALLQQQKVRSLEAGFSQLRYALSDESLSGKNLETQILNSVVKLQAAASRGDYTQLGTQADLHKRLVLRREFLYSESSAAELGNASLGIGQELATLQAYQSQSAQTIIAPQTGVFSTYVDGYEAIFMPALLDEIAPADFRALVSKAPQSNDGAVGKLVTSATWYVALLVEEDKLPLFKKQSEVSLRTASIASAVPMDVEQIGYVKDGEAVVLLSSRENMGDALGLRTQQVSVVFRSEQGIRIPKTALRVLEDGTAGVYTAVGYRAEFKPITVVAEDKSDYIVRANPTDSESKQVLRSGDELIISAAELYDGKVVR